MDQTELDTLLSSLRVRTCASGLAVAESFILKEFSLPTEELESAAKKLTFGDLEIKALETKEADYILVYDAICSTKSKDRDGDVIETAGLELDPSMPLLFSHSQQLCIGKHLQVVSKDDKQWISKFAIADTALGRDCAVLVKHGALRKSIGFMPTELEPLGVKEDASGAKYATGWHIKKAQVFETSLVSIPANSEAKVLTTYSKEFGGICEAYSRGELKHEPVLKWAKALYEKRPVIVQGADLKKDTMGGELPKGQPGKCPQCHQEKLSDDGTCQACGAIADGKSTTVETKDKEVADTKGLSHYPKGSFEQVQNDLDRSARKYLKGKGTIDEDDYGWTSLYATFADKAVVCLYMGEGKYKCYSIGYTTKDGVAQWSGEPAEVDIEPAIISKRFAEKLAVKTVETKEIVKEVVKEIEKAMSFDELRRKFISEAIKCGPEGYKALKEAADLYEGINYSRDTLVL